MFLRLTRPGSQFLKSSRGPRDTNELLGFLTEFEESSYFWESRRDETRPQMTPHNGGGRSSHYVAQRQYQGHNRFQRQPNAPSQQQQANVNNPPISQLDISGNGQASHS